MELSHVCRCLPLAQFDFIVYRARALKTFLKLLLPLLCTLLGLVS